MKRYIYKLYDEDKTLLYIGCTINPKERIFEHKCKPWGKDIHSHETREAGEDPFAEEAKEIRECKPLYNVMHTEIKDVEIKRRIGMPISTIQDFKKSDKDGWRYKVYKLLKKEENYE